MANKKGTSKKAANKPAKVVSEFDLVAQAAKAKAAEATKAAKAAAVEVAKAEKAAKAEAAKAAKAAKAAAAKLVKDEAKAKAKADKEAKALQPVTLNKAQEKSLEMVKRNQERILANADQMLKIAFDSGERLLKLKEEVTAKFGRQWKVWAQTEGNLGLGYEQATRYMKLAANPAQFALVDSTSIEGAVKQIEHQLKPEKAAKAESKKAEARTQKIATAGIISNATLEEVEQCTDVDELRGLITLCKARIEELEDGAPATKAEDPANEALDGVAYEVDDDDTADVVDDFING